MSRLPEELQPNTGLIRQRLARSSSWLVGSFAIAASFSTYFCMYAFRKPFAAANYLGSSPVFSDVQLKTGLIIAQLLGYALAKYVGARILPSLSNRSRAPSIIALILVSWLALLGFALFPGVAQLLMLFINGLSLGMIWGLVVSFLEGRKSSEVLLAGLSCSFIVASSSVKTVGLFLLQNWNIDEYWMPFYTGSLFLAPLLVSVWLLTQVPPPTEQDRITRSPRTPMSGKEQRLFLKQVALPLTLLLALYFFLTAYRDYRDNFGIELFQSLGYAEEPTIFLQTETPIAGAILLLLSLLALVKQHRRALVMLCLMMMSGLLLLPLATSLRSSGMISGALWMTCVGFGSYLTYVPFGSVLFDRLMAHTRAAGNAVFGIYLADAMGYTGSIFLQLFGDHSNALARLGFFEQLSSWLGYGGATLVGIAAVFLIRIEKRSA